MCKGVRCQRLRSARYPTHTETEKKKAVQWSDLFGSKVQFSGGEYERFMCGKAQFIQGRQQLATGGERKQFAKRQKACTAHRLHRNGSSSQNPKAKFRFIPEEQHFMHIYLFLPQCASHLCLTKPPQIISTMKIVQKSAG
jgi:hypothetical protein